MKILLTGGAGFIGSNVADFLLLRGHSLTIIDNLSTGRLENLDLAIEKIDFINDSLEDFNLDALGSFDGVIHLAAQASVPLSISNFKESSTTNINSSINIFDFCSRTNTPLVYASSSAVYGEMDIGDDSRDKVNLLSPYSVDKYVMEIYTNMLLQLRNLSSIGLRFFNVYGPRQDPASPYSGVISIFIDNLLCKKDVMIYGGYQTRDFVYVEDVVKSIYKALLLCSNQILSDAINILSGKETSIDELFDIICQETQIKVGKKYLPLPQGDPSKSSGSLVKMEQLLGRDHNDFIILEEGIRQTIKHIKENE